MLGSAERQLGDYTHKQVSPAGSASGWAKPPTGIPGRSLRNMAKPKAPAGERASGLVNFRESRRRREALTRRVRIVCLAVPGQILSITGDDPLLRSARVSFGGVIKDVNLAYVPEAQVGQYVIVHVGFAISVVDEGEAARVFEYLREIGELEEAKES